MDVGTSSRDRLAVWQRQDEKGKTVGESGGTSQDCLAEPAGKSTNLFTASTLSYTDTWTIGWFFLIRIPAASAACAVPYELFVCRSTWSKYRPTSGRSRWGDGSTSASCRGSACSRSFITRCAIQLLLILGGRFT